MIIKLFFWQFVQSIFAEFCRNVMEDILLNKNTVKNVILQEKQTKQK